MNNIGKGKKIMWLLTLLLTGIALAVIWMTHRAVPFMMDDLWYSTLLYDETPIRTLKDILDAQIWHYQNWGGRSMTHTILQLTLLAGQSAADILNVGMTALLAWIMCVTAGNRRLAAFLGAVCLMTGCNANWKMSMFWQAGAANYLYITVPVLFFLYCYLRHGEETPEKELKGIALWILPLGLLSGWSNENMGPAVWLLTLAVMLLCRRERRRVPLWMVLGSLGSLAGSIMVVAAPGNFVRGKEAANGYGLLWNCFLRGYAQSKAALEYLFPTLLILGGLLVCYKGALGLKLGRRNLLLLGVSALSWGAMILSPHYPDRAAFGTMILLLCVILSMAGGIVREKPGARWYLWGGLVFLWLRAMYVMGEFLAISWGWIR